MLTCIVVLVVYITACYVNAASVDYYNFCGYMKCKSTSKAPTNAVSEHCSVIRLNLIVFQVFELWDWDLLSASDRVTAQNVSLGTGYYHVFGQYSDGWPENIDWFFQMWAATWGHNYYNNWEVLQSVHVQRSPTQHVPLPRPYAQILQWWKYQLWAWWLIGVVCVNFCSLKIVD